MLSRFRTPAGKGLFALLALVAVVALALAGAPLTGGSQVQARAFTPPAAAGTALRSPHLGLGDPPVFGPNYKANSDSTSYGQHEPSLAVSRTHPNTVVVAAKDYRNGDQKEVWIDTSTDGGVTWPASLQLQMPGINPAQYPLMSDPVVMARDDGRIYVACLAYNNQNAVFITWTDDDGVTWHNPSVQISPTDANLDDKDWFAIDNNPASTYYHRMYMMYSPGANYVAEQHSTDGGLTWTPRQQIGTGGTEYTYPVVGSDGTVYNFMMLNWGGDGIGTIQMTKSTNGGSTWSAPVTVSSAYQISYVPRTNPQVRFFNIISGAVDPNNGTLYAAWPDNRNSATHGLDVMYVRSTDGGNSWTSPTLIGHTEERECSLCDNITPVITVGADSKLHAFWLDRTIDPNHNLFDSWYSDSTDGGVTWEPDVRVSTVSQDLSVGLPPGSGGAAGDYWGLDTVGNAVYVAWNDTRFGNQDILVSKGTFGPAATATATATTVPPSPTNTVVPTNTPATPQPTSTPGGATDTPVPTGTATFTVTSVPTSQATRTPEPTATACPTGQVFTDVAPDNTFYSTVNYIACRQIIAGYRCGGPGEPCDQQQRPYFRPNNPVTRGQFSKIVSNAVGFTDDVTGRQTYTDVPPSETFWVWIERLTIHGVMSGYQCGGPGEPCDGQNRPYFRPGSLSTRAQIAKILSNTAGYSENHTEQVFIDVPPSNEFYQWIMRLYSRNILGGYQCDTGPCFRPFNDATRGQTSKIVANTFFTGCCMFKPLP